MSDSHLFMAMDLITGGNLAGGYRCDGEHTAAIIVRQIVRALRYLHDRHIAVCVRSCFSGDLKRIRQRTFWSVHPPYPPLLLTRKKMYVAFWAGYKDSTVVSTCWCFAYVHPVLLFCLQRNLNPHVGGHILGGFRARSEEVATCLFWHIVRLLFSFAVHEYIVDTQRCPLPSPGVLVSSLNQHAHPPPPCRS